MKHRMMRTVAQVTIPPCFCDLSACNTNKTRHGNLTQNHLPGRKWKACRLLLNYEFVVGSIEGKVNDRKLEKQNQLSLRQLFIFSFIYFFFPPQISPQIHDLNKAKENVKSKITFCSCLKPSSTDATTFSILQSILSTIVPCWEKEFQFVTLNLRGNA